MAGWCLPQGSRAATGFPVAAGNARSSTTSCGKRSGTPAAAQYLPVRWCAGRPSQTDIARKQVARYELFGDNHGRVVGQHDPAGPDADRAGAASDVADADRRRHGNARQIVVLRQPVAGVTGGLSMLREVEGIGERIGGRESFADIRKIEYGKLNHLVRLAHAGNRLHSTNRLPEGAENLGEHRPEIIAGRITVRSNFTGNQHVRLVMAEGVTAGRPPAPPCQQEQCNERPRGVESLDRHGQLPLGRKYHVTEAAICRPPLRTVSQNQTGSIPACPVAVDRDDHQHQRDLVDKHAQDKGNEHHDEQHEHRRPVEETIGSSIP